MRAEPLPQRRMQQVGGRVVAHRRQAQVAVDHRLGGLARLQLSRLELERQGLVVANAVDVDDLRRGGRGLDHARIRDLSAPLGIERAFRQLGKQLAIYLLDRAHRRL